MHRQTAGTSVEIVSELAANSFEDARQCCEKRVLDQRSILSLHLANDGATA